MTSFVDGHRFVARNHADDEEHQLERRLAASIAHHGAAVSALKWHLEMEGDDFSLPTVATNGGVDWRNDWRPDAATNGSNWRSATNASDWRGATVGTNEGDWRFDGLNESNWSVDATNGTDWRADTATDGRDWRADIATNGRDWRADTATDGRDWRADAATDGRDWQSAATATNGSRSQSGLRLKSEERNAGVRAYLQRKLQAPRAPILKVPPTWRFPRAVSLPSPPPTPAPTSSMAPDLWGDVPDDLRNYEPFDEEPEADYEANDGRRIQSYDCNDYDCQTESVRSRYEYRQVQPVCTDTSLDGTGNWPHQCRPFFFRRADAPSVRYY